MQSQSIWLFARGAQVMSMFFPPLVLGGGVGGVGVGVRGDGVGPCGREAKNAHAGVSDTTHRERESVQ